MALDLTLKGQAKDQVVIPQDRNILLKGLRTCQDVGGSYACVYEYLSGVNFILRQRKQCNDNFNSLKFRGYQFYLQYLRQKKKIFLLQ